MFSFHSGASTKLQQKLASVVKEVCGSACVYDKDLEFLNGPAGLQSSL